MDRKILTGVCIISLWCTIGYGEELEIGGVKLSQERQRPEVIIDHKSSGPTLRDREPHKGHAGLKRDIFILNTGKVEFMLKYVRCVDPIHQKEGTPIVWYDTGIGLQVNPGSGWISAGWYCNNFINFNVNGKSISSYNLAAVRYNKKEGRGEVDFMWDTEEAQLLVKFWVLGGDDRLFLKGILTPKVKINSLGVSLQNYPSFYGTDGKRWVVANTTSAVPISELKAFLPSDYWFFYADKVYDPASNEKAQGPSAVLLLPEEPKEVTVTLNPYAVGTKIVYPPETKEFHLSFWKFGKVSNEEALKYLKNQIEETKKLLKE